MDTWFGKIRQKIVVDKVDENLDSDEERRKKENQLKDTLRKLNTDEVLNDDEIERVSEISRRSDKEQAAKVEAGPATEVHRLDDSVTVVQKPKQGNQEKRATTEDEAASSPVVRIIEEAERYESQFWD